MGLPVSAADLARAAEFANRVVGLPYDPEGFGPDAYMCWGLVRDGVRLIHDRPLPRALPEQLMDVALGIIREWRRVDRPTHGAVGFTSSTASPRHVVLYLANDRGGVLHALEGHGVVFWPLIMMTVYGFQDIHWYVPAVAGRPGAALVAA